jgi:hypothetical protein
MVTAQELFAARSSLYAISTSEEGDVIFELWKEKILTIDDIVNMTDIMRKNFNNTIVKVLLADSKLITYAEYKQLPDHIIKKMASMNMNDEDYIKNISEVRVEIEKIIAQRKEVEIKTEMMGDKKSSQLAQFSVHAQPVLTNPVNDSVISDTDRLDRLPMDKKNI